MRKKEYLTELSELSFQDKTIKEIITQIQVIHLKRQKYVQLNITNIYFAYRIY